MGAIDVQLWTHKTVRAVPCALCGVDHEQLYVGVALRDGQDFLGDLCPRCLAVPPDQAAGRGRAGADQLGARGKPG
jgi:hypothetical protein